ncbi:nucleic acid-binding protein [Halolamina salifodinae]|uniref:Putative nucleic acid-binding protein n=1 Tax=Halolamina salifodinae TaxID=1202767 RepID=A0A8T4GX87_9EURY|nr:nucleic acid-binding protein [Halolamina salifodinae]MBP1987556.1 putative nucleic acid-binding protein [Halolamina salifodinae]
MIVAVTDAGPLIHLGEIDSLELPEVIDELVVPESVRRELEAGGAPGGFDDRSVEVATAGGDESWVEAGLDAGEAAALAVAADRDAILLTDDLAARDAATETGVEVHGSIGIIALASGRGGLTEDEAAQLMRSLQTDTSLFVTDAVVEHGIEILREDSDG